MNTDTPSLKKSVKAGLASGKENALPGFILWLFALAVVLSYYFVPAMGKTFQIIGNLKIRGGFLYSIISTAIFGGILPFAYRFFRNPKSFSGSIWGSGLFLTLFWAWKGFEVDLLYRTQDLIFGTGPEFSKVAPKVLFDQFIYGPIWASWVQALFYLWMESNFSIKKIKEHYTFKLFLWHAVTVYFSSVAIWFPMVCIIYAMPPNLQIPLFNIVMCFWGLMIGSLSKKTKEKDESGERGISKIVFSDNF